MVPLAQGAAQLVDGDVRGLVEKLPDQMPLRLDTSGATVAAQRPGARIALHPLQRPPAAHTRGADAEPRRRGSMARPSRDGSENPGPQIERQSF
jgi:hypothetical protein